MPCPGSASEISSLILWRVVTRFTSDHRESARQVTIRVPSSLSFPPSPPTWISQPGTLSYPEPVLSEQRGLDRPPRPPGRLICLPLAVIHWLHKKIITLKSQQEVFPAWQPPPVLPPAAAILCQAPGRPAPQPASPLLRHPLPASPACRRHLPACIFPGEGPELGV